MTKTIRNLFVLPFLALVPTIAAWGQAVVITNGTNLGVWSIGEVQIPLTATGGNGTYTWDIASGALPAGLAIRTDIPPGFGPAQAGIIGVATTQGTANFTLRVTSNGASATQPVILRITSLTAQDDGQLPDGFAGVPYSYTFTPVGNTGAVQFSTSITVGTPSAVANPFRLTAAGLLSGTPTTAGNYNVSLSFTDQTTGDTCSRGFFIWVSALQITSPGVLPNATQNSTYSYRVTAHGGDGNYSFSTNGLPDGLSLDPTSGLISGTVNTGANRYSTYITVSDPGYGNYSKQVIIDVIGVTPTLPSQFVYGSFLDDCTVGLTCSRGIGNGSGKAPFIWTVSGLPQGMTFRPYDAPNGPPSYFLTPGDVELYGTPVVAGNFNVTVTVTDANSNSATQVYALHVSNLMTDPGMAGGAQGTPYSFTFRVLGGAGPYAAQNLNLYNGQCRLPDGLSQSGLKVSGTPLEDGGFCPRFHFTDSASGSLTVTQYPYFNGPTANTIQLSNYDTFFLNVNQSFSLQVCCGGVSFTESGSLPPGMTFSSAGLLSGTPTVVGTYPILVTASSGTDSGSRQIILAVTPLAPTTDGNLPFGNVGVFYSQPLSAAGGTGSLTWTLVPGTYLPPGLSIAGSTLSGTPTGPGLFYFTVIASDSGGNSNRVYFNLAIYPNGATPPLFIKQNANLGNYFIGDDQIQLWADGGTGTYTWSLKAGSTLPPGCALRTDTPPWWSNPSTGILCLATTPGNYSFTLTVTSGSQSVSQLYTLRISNLMLMDTGLPDAFVNRPYSYTVTPMHADGTPVGAVTYGSPNGVPPGMTFSNGTLSGTPTASGYYGVNFTISDGVDTTNSYFGINVFLVHIDSPGVLPNATQNAAYSYTLTASGGVGPYTFDASYVPYGLVLNSSTGAITGTIYQYGGGPASFQVTVTDSNRVSYYKTMVIDLIGVTPALPWIPYFGLGDCSVGMGCERSVQVFDGGTAPFTWRATGLPPGMGFRQGSGGNNGNMGSYVSPVGAELWGIPTQVGSYTIVATVTDVNGVSTTQNLSLYVSPLFIDSGFADGTYNVPYTSTLHVVGGSGSYTRQVLPGTGSYPSGTALSGLTLSGTPVENGNFGEYLVISDTTLPAHNTVTQYRGLFVAGASGTTIQIGSGNLGTWRPGDSINYALSACCVPSYTWTFLSGSFPPGSPAFAFSSAGVITGTPTAAGTYSFLVQAADQINPANFARRLITITVTPISINTGSLPYGNVSAAYSQTLSATGGVGAITWSVLQTDSPLPPGLSLNPATGVISGKPTSTGQYNFSVMATDTAGNNATGYFTVDIYAFGSGPPLSLNFGPNFGTFSIGDTLEYPLMASGGVPPYTYSATPGAATIPGMRVINYSPWPYYPAGVTGAYVGLLATAGTFSSSIRVADSAGKTLDEPVNLTVLPITILTNSTLPYATLGQPYSFQFTGYGGSGNYSWTLYNLPAALSGFTFSGVTPGQLTGTATASGYSYFNVTMTDLSNNTQVSFGFNLTVNPFAITNNAVLPQGTVGHPYVQTLTAPNCGPDCVWTVPATNLPSGLSLQASNSSTALSSCTEAGGVTCGIAGTPTAATWAGPAVTATGSSGTASKVLGIQVLNPPQPLTMSTTSIGNGTAGAQSSTLLAAQGGSPPYSWSVTGGSLPPGTRLAGPGETLSAYFIPGLTYLWGRPMVPGSYNFALAVRDANNNSVSRNFTWYIQQTALATSYLPVSATLVFGTPYSEGLLGLGGTGTYTFATTSATNPMPSGLTLSPAGVVSGTPLNSGSYSVPIQMTDSAANVLLTYLNLSIGSGTPSTVYIGAGPFLGTFQLGNTTLIGLGPSGGSGGPYTFSVPTTAPATPSNALPPGCGLEFGPTALTNSSSYYLACHPLAAGTYSVLLKVQDSTGNVGYKTLIVTFAPFTLYNSALQSGTVGVPYSDTLPVWDNSGTVSWSLVSGTVMPPGLSISGNTISGTPTTAGNYTFTLSATDASGAVVNFGFSLTVSTLSITDPQALPIATLGVPYSFTFHATGGTAALTWSVTGLVSPLTLSPTTGILSGTPTSTNTSSRIQVTVTDGSTTYSKAFTLWIRNQYPQELNYSLTGANLADAYVGQNYAVALLPSGGLPPAFWTLVPGFSLPPGLSLATGASLSPSLIPNATYLAGAPSTAGFYTFNMIMTDTAGNQTLRTFTLNVSPMGILSTSLLTGTEGVAYNQQFTAVGGTPPYTFTYRISSISTPMFPPGITGSPAGLISGTPTSTGSYSFFVTAADSAGHTFTTSTGLSVVGPTRISFNAAQLFNLTAGVGTANTPNIAAGATYSYSLLSGSLPAGLTLNPTGSPYLISGAPTAAGAYTFTVRATDTSNPANFADRTFGGSVSLMMAIIPKQSEVPAGRVGAPYSYTFRVVGGTPPYTFQESPLYPIPPGLALSPSGTLSGTPQVAGTFSFYATVSDSLSASMTTSLGTMNIVTPGQANPMTPIGGSLGASVGKPAAFELDALVQGGAPPYGWAVAAGSSLPPGMRIAPGSNGVPAFLVGIPTTAGGSAVVLTATDAALQSVNVSLSVSVGPISITPAVLPNGVVGSPYSAALSVSGGTAPYTIALWATSDLPVGLTMSPAGVLSGTPQQPGRFQVLVTITDSAANFQYRIFTVGIDRAGQAPAIGISPAATQMSYVRTGPAPSPIQIGITGTSAGLPYTAMVGGVPGASLSATSGNAPDALNLSLNTTGLTPGVYAGVVAVNSLNSTNTFQGVPFVLTVTDPPPCSYTLSSNAGSVTSGPGTDSFSMATGSLCAWTATVPNPADNWITIASGGGIGPGNVSFNTTANAGTASRVGTIQAGGQNYQVTQFGSACSLAISPSAISVTAAGGAATINVNSNGACPWTASGLGATPTTGTGNGQVQVTIPPTASGNPPPLTATIAGQTLTVNQSGAACIASLDASSASYGAGSGSGSVNVSIPSGCSYSTVPGPSWITITSNASGSGPGPVNLAYTVAANSTTVARSGTLSIGGQTYQIAQSGIACSVTVDASASGSPFGSAGGSGAILVTANGSNCSWTASGAAAWASVTPSSGTGNVTLTVNATSNSGSASSRATSFTIAGTSVGIVESGITCTYALGSTAGSVPSTGGSGSVGVIAAAACPWTASSTPGWANITPVNPVSSSGSGDVLFTASANPGALPRTTTFTIAGTTYSLSQAGAPCTYSLSSTNTTAASTGASGSYTFTAAPGCSAGAVSYSSWIAVTTSSAPDGSSGTVNYTVAANVAGGSRTGYIQLPGQSFTIVQTGAPCAYSFNSYGQAFSTAGGPGSVLGSPSAGGCVPTVGTTQPTIVTLGALQGPVLDIFTLPYTVSPFTSVTPAIRYATITFGGQFFTVKQRSW